MAGESAEASQWLLHQVASRVLQTSAPLPVRTKTRLSGNHEILREQRCRYLLTFQRERKRISAAPVLTK
jgi:hypothetical protein